MGNRRKQAKTAVVHAERRWWTGTAPDALWDALGMHNGPAEVAGRAVKVGVLPAMNLVPVNYGRPMFRVLERAG